MHLKGNEREMSFRFSLKAPRPPPARPPPPSAFDNEEPIKNSTLSYEDPHEPETKRAKMAALTPGDSSVDPLDAFMTHLSKDPELHKPVLDTSLIRRDPFHFVLRKVANVFYPT